MTSILPLVLRDVSYEAGGERLIDSISFELEEGGCTVMGPNGAGKSLTLRLCHGLIPPSSGTVNWEGPAAAGARRRQAMVFQRPVMLRRSAIANVTYALSLAKVPGTGSPSLAPLSFWSVCSLLQRTHLPVPTSVTRRRKRACLHES